MFAKILVPVDGSDASHEALRAAGDIASKYGSEIKILCVYRHHSPLETSLSMVRPYEPDKPDKALKEYASEIVENAKKIAREHGFEKVTGYVKQGQPARTIVSFAQDHKIELIVIGNRGSGDIEGFLLGSVSHKVTSLAHCHCLTIKSIK